MVGLFEKNIKEKKTTEKEKITILKNKFILLLKKLKNNGFDSTAHVKKYSIKFCYSIFSNNAYSSKMIFINK